MRPDLLIFDCDGVLIDSEVLACRAVAEELRSQNFDYSDAEVALRFAGWTDEHIADLVAQEKGHAPAIGFVETVAARALALFEGELQAMPAVADFLKTWPGAFCVASNAGVHRLERALEIVELDDIFPKDRQFSAALVAQPKPAADLHQFVCRTLNVNPDRALVIEDSVTGVQGAVAAGVPVVGFLGASHLPDDQEDKLRDAGAFAIFDDFADLPALLESL